VDYEPATLQRLPALVVLVQTSARVLVYARQGTTATTTGCGEGHVRTRHGSQKTVRDFATTPPPVSYTDLRLP
jgi:hypothetical protein